MKNFLPLQLLLLLTASLNPAVIVAENITAAQWVVSGAEGKPLHAGPSAVGGNPLARAVAQSLHKRRQHKHLQQHQQNPEHAPKLLTHAAKQHGSERHVLANAAQQPPEGHRLRPVLEAARNFLSIEAPVQRKRLALLHALEGQSPDAAHPLSDAAAAVNRALVDFGEHMSCRCVRGCVVNLEGRRGQHRIGLAVVHPSSGRPCQGSHHDPCVKSSGVTLSQS
jgi:hypothetical protein